MDNQLPASVLYLWPRRTVHVGSLARPIEFSQAAASLTVSLGGPMRFSTPGMARPHSCTSLLLRPGDKVNVDAGDAVIGTCYLDALGQDHAMLADQMAECVSGVYCDAPRELAFRALFQHMLDHEMAAEEAYNELEQLINPHQRAYQEADPRVATVVALIRSSVSENRSVEALAQAVNLSVPRLVQLFRQQVGVPIRRYRQWHRLFVTTINVARGRSLTDAALDAGFTDSAHFSHTFRSTLGLRPSEIFAELARSRLVVSDELGGVWESGHSV